MAPQKTIWQAHPRRSVADTIFVAFMATAAGLLLLLVIGALSVWIATELNSTTLGVVFFIPMCYYAFRMLWLKMVVARLRSRLELLADRVRIGQGWLAHEDLYDDIQLLELEVEIKNIHLLGVASHHANRSFRKLKIDSSAGRTTLPLHVDEIESCANALNARCHYAVYWDANGQEHLPRSNQQPLKTWATRQKKAFRDAVSAAAMGVVGLVMLLMFVLLLTGVVQPKQDARIPLFLWQLLLMIISPLLIWEAFQRFFEWIRLRRDVRQMMAAGITDEGEKDSGLQ